MKRVISLFYFALFFISFSCFSQVDSDIFSKFESKFYLIDGYNINVEVKGTGKPIFFLPGGPGNSHDYMQANFGQYYTTNTVVFFDFLGRGKSDNAKDTKEYSVENDVALIEKLRIILKFDKISLVGHSYGTVPAQAYAIQHPDQVDKLLLISGFHSGAMWQANCDSYNRYAKTHFPEKWQQVDSLRALGYVSSQEPLKSLYGSIPTKYVYYHNTAIVGNAPKEPYRNWADDVYATIIGKDGDFDVSGSMINQDYRQQLKNISAKTLIVAGRYDGVSTPEFNLQYKTFMPQADFVMFEQSGHNPYLEEPEKFYALFDAFFGIN
ncbi:MAG: alpha/beta hydrolase [Flavobacteriales bacterium]|nr:alpha/beta hydrolase [Flavobacteriia bacterium]NCP05364.1 alpha/beta hydrolase [Flavobacteriales bacterium]PIV92553.1 MAG: alpha/beta hydrolase [Flavobacteriaceae bacterium CG17_big_fil_post_rev_8_21_14_2_50_33_15]PIY12655.1 MAG: alpha/beta hydrolase [Flavobacteriaceae bacterium CG_4_10_14_3_um_filter_33_47]PJB18085.1 MAG: alpha/beta hydrolase [Flavobacteriaceae bacterium CG_4_9_14_3_um_filter_33_16]